MRSASDFVRWARRRRIVRSSKEVKKSQEAVILFLLPHDVILEILSKLPVNFLLRFRCVSKSWNFIISDPNFLKLLRMSDDPSLLYYPEIPVGRKLNCLSFNNKQSLFSDAQLYIPREVMGDGCYRVLGSCNGLICVHALKVRNPGMVPRSGDFIMWNPSTRQIRILSKYPLKHGVLLRYGFGYDGLTDDYKLVMTALEHPKAEIHVYSVKSNTWGSRGRIHDTEKWRLFDEKAIHLDGILHWVATPYAAPLDLQVTTFDLGTQDSGKIGLPKSYPVYLGALSGWLCFWCYHKDVRLMETDSDDLKMEVWVMKEYGVMSSWTKLLVVRPETLQMSLKASLFLRFVFVPFLLSKDDDELFCLVNRNGKGWVAVKFNLTGSTFEEIQGGLPPSIKFHYSFPYPYMESLVPIGKSRRSMRDCFAFWSCYMPNLVRLQQEKRRWRKTQRKLTRNTLWKRYEENRQVRGKSRVR